MTFVSTSVSGTEKKLTIKGKLTIKNVTKDVVLNGTLSKEIKDPWGNQRVAITGKTVINRQDYGLAFNKATELGPVVGNEVIISISAEAVKPAPKAEAKTTKAKKVEVDAGVEDY